MDTVRTLEPEASADTSPAVFAQSPMHAPLPRSGSVIPDDVTALIYRPSRSAMTSAPARNRWCLVFERQMPSYLEPLMGWTGSDETQHQVSLQFPTLQAAVRYAERQGFRYGIQMPTREPLPRADDDHPSDNSGAFADAVLHRLGITEMRGAYRRAIAGAREREDPEGPDHWNHPGQVVEDPALSLTAKRSILMNWAWNEYLLDQATTEGMPENDRVSRLDEVERALLELETDRRSVNAAARTVAEDTGSIPENGLGVTGCEIRLISAHTPIGSAGGGAAGSRRSRQPDDAQAYEFSPAADPTIRRRPLELRPT